MDNNNNNKGISTAMALMNGPIPGASLTVAPGSRPYEQPPKYTKEDDALYAILNSLTSKTSGAATGVALSKGVYASDIANTFLVEGVAKGMWTPDLAALIAKRTLAAVVATGHAQGVKDMKYMKPKPNTEMDQVLNMPDVRGAIPSTPKEVLKAPTPVPPVPTKEPVPSTNKINGVMGE